MNKLTFAAFLCAYSLVFPSFAMAGSAEMDKLTAQFQKVDYMNPSERKKARDLVPTALEHSQKLVEQRTKSPTLQNDFRALVRLVAASNPYDVESAGVADLVIVMIRFSLGAEYDQVARTLSNACEKENLSYYVGQKLCKEGCDKIPVVRSYEDCLLAQKKPGPKK